MDADLRHLLGQRGTVNTADTTAVTGEFSAIYVREDCVFSAFTEENATGTITSDTWEKGEWIFGRITAYTLASGKVRAYKR